MLLHRLARKCARQGPVCSRDAVHGKPNVVKILEQAGKVWPHSHSVTLTIEFGGQLVKEQYQGRWFSGESRVHLGKFSFDQWIGKP